MTSIPPDADVKAFEPALSSLKNALDQLPALFKQSNMNPLMPRPVLNFFASLSCGVYLLEHAIWSHHNGELTRDADLEAFRRWVLEGDLQPSLTEIARIARNFEARSTMNSTLVYGPRGTAVHKL